jgi:predicted Zn-dependent protease with MMP-like domain
MIPVTEERELAVIESIYDALDRYEPAEALVIARRALGESPGDDPVLRFLAGVALSALDRPAEAVGELRRAVSLDPYDAEFRAELALALFRSCLFDEADEASRLAIEADEDLPDAHHARALILERRGKTEDAERHFHDAARLDPERFPLPGRIDADEFGRTLERARDHLPPEFRAHLDRIGLIVEDLPPDELLLEEKPPLDPELLGLFHGVPIDQPESLSPGGELPPRIYLFKRNLERFAAEPADLHEEIAVTLYHELGHYLGMEEDDLEELDFD